MTTTEPAPITPNWRYAEWPQYYRRQAAGATVMADRMRELDGPTDDDGIAAPYARWTEQVAEVAAALESLATDIEREDVSIESILGHVRRLSTATGWVVSSLEDAHQTLTVIDREGVE